MGLLFPAFDFPLQRSKEEGGLQLWRHPQRPRDHGVPRGHQTSLSLIQVRLFGL